jgi:hypothetical protein
MGAQVLGTSLPILAVRTRDCGAQDPLRRCKGAEKHRRLMHISESVKDAKVVRPAFLSKICMQVPDILEDSHAPGVLLLVDSAPMSSK